MTKNRISIGVISVLLGVLTLSSCSGSSVTKKDGVLVSLTGANGETIELLADDIYGKMATDKPSVTKFYNAITEVVIRNEMEKPENASKKAEILDDAEDDVAEQERIARNNASNNGTKYEDEWEAILEAKGVEDRKGLKDLIAYQMMEANVKEEWLDDEKLDQLFETENDDRDYLSQRAPYHVRHILVKVSAAGGGDFVNSEITQTEAEKLIQVVEGLAKGGSTTFGQIANLLSDDKDGEESSQRLLGDLGIMDLQTSFVPEFKLGLYSYDKIYAKNPNADRLKIEDEVVDKFTEMGLDSIGEIPFGSIVSLKKVADKTQNIAGGSVNEGNAFYYPRNVLFNKYFNRHNIMVITPNDVNVAGFNADGTLDATEDFTGTENPAYLTERFQDVNIGGVTKKVLVDEKGQVILVARASASYQGIHFMVVERSALEDVQTRTNTTLREYFTYRMPGDSRYPVDTNGKAKQTFVNAIGADDVLMKNRAETIENAIKGYDKNINQRMFEELFVSQNVKINDETWRLSVEKYLESLVINDDHVNQEQLQNEWKGYVEMLERQQEVRIPERLLSETCAINFYENYDESGFTQVGGACYYVK